METRTAPHAAAARWRPAPAVRFTTPEGRTEEAAGMVMEGTPLAVTRRAGLKRNGVPLDPWMVTAGGRVVGRQKTRQAARLFAERAAPLADWTSLPDSPPDRLWLARDGQPLDRLLARLSVAVAAGDLAAFDADQQELREALENAAALPPVDEDAPWARLVEIPGPRWLLVGRDVERLDRALGLPDGGGRGVWLAGRHGDLAFLGGDRVPALVMDRFGAAAAYAALRNSGAAVRRLRWSHGDLTPVFPADRRAVIDVAGNRLTAVLDAEHRTVTLQADPDRPSPLCDPLAPDCRRDDWTVGGLAVPDRPETGRDAAQAALSAPLRFPITVTIGGRPQELIARIASSDPPPAARLCSPLDELRLERPDGRPFERGTEFRRLSSGIRYHPDPLARLAEVARARAQDVLDERWRRSQRVLKRIDKAAGSRSAFARALSRALGARTVLELRNEAVGLAGFWGGETSAGADLAKAAGRMQKRIDAAGIADTRLEEARGAAARAVARRPPLAERPEIRALFHPEMPAYPDPDRVNRAVEALRPVIAKRRPERRQDGGTEDPQYSLGWTPLPEAPEIPALPPPGEVWAHEGWLYQGIGFQCAHAWRDDPAYIEDLRKFSERVAPIVAQTMPQEFSAGRFLVTGDLLATVGRGGALPAMKGWGCTLPVREADGSIRLMPIFAATAVNPANLVYHEAFHVHAQEGRLHAAESRAFRDPGFLDAAVRRYGLDRYGGFSHDAVEEAAAHLSGEMGGGDAGDDSGLQAGRERQAASLRAWLAPATQTVDELFGTADRIARGTVGRRSSDPVARAQWAPEWPSDSPEIVSRSVFSAPSAAFSLGAVPRLPPQLLSYRRQPEPPAPDRIPDPGESILIKEAGQEWLYRAVTPGAAVGLRVDPDPTYQAQQNLLTTALRPLASSCLPTDLAEGRVHVVGAIVAKVGGAGGPIEPLSGLTAPLRSGDGSVHHHAFVAMTDANPANALFHESVHVNLREGRLSADEFLSFCDPESCRLGAERFGFAGYPVRRFAEELAAHAHAEAAAGPAGRTPVAWRSAGDDVRAVRAAALLDHLVADLALPDRASAVLQALADGTVGARPAVPEARELWLREMGRHGGAADPAIFRAEDFESVPPRQYSVAAGRDAPLSPADRDALQALSRHLSGAGLSWGFALPGADPRGRRIFTDKTYSAAVGEVRLRPTPDGSYAAEALPWTAPAGRLEQGEPGKQPTHPAMEKAVAAAASFAGGTAMPPVRVLDEEDALGDVPPWRLSRAEYVGRRMPDLADLDLRAIDPRLVKPLARRHAAAVFDAVARGEPVPDRVLAGHPVLVQMDAAARAVAPDDRSRPVNEPEPGEEWTARPAVLAVSGPDGWEKVTLTVEARGPFAVHRPVDLRIVGWTLAGGPDLDSAALRNAAAAARGRSDAADGAMRRYEVTALAEALDRIAADMDEGTAYRPAAAREIARARSAMPRADLAAALGGRAAPLTETRTSGRGWVVSHLPTGLPLVTAAHAVPTKNECRRVVDAIGTGWPWTEVTFGRLPDLLRSPAYRAAADRWGEAGAAIHAVGQARKAVRQAQAAVIKAQATLVQVQDKETAAIEKRNGILGYAPSADIPAAGLHQYAMRSDAVDAQSGPVRAIRQDEACGKLLSVRDRDTGAGLALETHRMSTLTAATVAEPSPLSKPQSGNSFPLSDPALRAAYADAAQTAADGDEGALTVARFAQGGNVDLFAAGVAADELRALARIANLPLADHGPEGVAVPVSALPVLRGFSAVPIVEADLTATAESRNWSRAALAGAGAAVGVAAAAGAVHLAGRDDVPVPLAAAEAVDEPIRNARELAEAALADAGQIAERLTRNAADVGASLAETRRMIEEALAGTAPSAAVSLSAVTAESPKADPSDLARVSEAEAAIRDGSVGALLTPADPAEPQAVADILARIDAVRAGIAAPAQEVSESAPAAAPVETGQLLAGVIAEVDARATETIRSALEPGNGGTGWYEGALDAARAVAQSVGDLQFSTGGGTASASIPAPAAIQPFYARNDEQGLAEARVRAQGIPSDDLANRAAVTAALLVRREADPAANPATLEALRAGKAVLGEEVRRREAGLQAIQPFFVAEGEAGRNEAVLRASRIPAPDLANRLAMTRAMLAAKLPEAGGSAGVRGSLERGVAVLEGETSRRAALDRPQDITRKPTRRGGMER